MARYEVFISFKNTYKGVDTPDAVMAEELYKALKQKGVKVFFSKASIMEQGAGNYRELIDDALDECVILVAVGTRADYLDSKWVKYEYASFHEDILSGIKDDKTCTVCSYVVGVPQADLPRPLRNLQSFQSLESTVEFVVNRLEVVRKIVAEQEKQNRNPDTVTEEVAPVEEQESKAPEQKDKNNKKDKEVKENTKSKRSKKSKKELTPEQKKKRKKKIIIAVSVIAFLIIAAVAGFFGFKMANTVKIPVIQNGKTEYIKAKKGDYSLDIGESAEWEDDKNIKEPKVVTEITKNTISAINKVKSDTIHFSNCSFESGCYLDLEVPPSKYDTMDSALSLSFCNCKGINTFKGMENKNIRYLNITSCGLTDDVLSTLKNTGINSLDISNNEKITSLNGIEEIISSNDFMSLDISNTSISDLSVLKDNINLDTISFSNTKVVSVAPLSGCNSLSNITADNNEISNIDNLANLQNLSSISFKNNNLTGVTDEFHSLKLRSIYLGDNKISDLSGFKNLTQVENLELENNNISNTISEKTDSFIVPSFKIEKVNIAGNGTDNTVSEKTFYDKFSFIIKSADKLEDLDLSNNNLTEEMLKELVKDAVNITRIDIDNNPEITNLDFLSSCTNIESLSASDCSISNIDGIAKCNKLHFVSLSHNKLTDISALSCMSTDAEFVDSLDVFLQYNNIEALSMPTSYSYRTLYVFGNKKLDPKQLAKYHGELLGISYMDGITADDTNGFMNVRAFDVPDDKKVNFKETIGPKLELYKTTPEGPYEKDDEGV